MRGVLFFLIVLVFSQSVFATCLLPSFITENNYQYNRKSCLEEAGFIFEAADPATADFQANIVNPKIKNFNISNGEEVHCRFYYQESGGKSAKFRCLQTNAKNQLLDSDGNVVVSAVRAKDDANKDTYLIDAKGEKIPELDVFGAIKRYKQAFLLKVRYYDGTSRNVENFVSVAASRLLWVLGIPTNTNIMTSKVVCFGCNSEPVRQTKVFIDRKGKYSVASVPHASIEFKIIGKRIYKSNTDAWTWFELNQMYQASASEHPRRLELEVFALVNQFLGYSSDKAMQHAIVCNKKDIADKVCLEPIAMVHDIGAAFGDRTSSSLSSAPRGNLDKYNKSKIFIPGTCSFTYADKTGSLPAYLTSAGQAEFLRRAKALTPEVLLSVIQASHIGYYQANPTMAKVAQREGAWVAAILAKVAEVRQAPCR